MMLFQRIPRIVFYLLVGCLVSRHAAALDYEAIGRVAYEYDFLNWNNSLIAFLIDPAGNKYIVKQMKPERGFCWTKIICETVALEVGDSIDIPQNHICIIPAGVPFAGKIELMPATLHTHVPGIRFDKRPADLFPGLSLKQRDGQGTRIGLTRHLIYQMSRHRDLPVMVAYDTFVNNPARHQHNFFYDQEYDTFYGIDMGASFHGDLCTLSLKTIQNLLHDRNLLLSNLEIKALRVYCDTLKKLVKLHNPSSLCGKFDSYALYAGLFDIRYFDVQEQQRCADYLERCKGVIHKSYDHAVQLIDALDKLIKKQRYKK